MMCKRARRFRFLGFFFTLAVLGGCSATALPNLSDLSAIENGDKTLLLFRVAATIEGEMHEPFSHYVGDDNVGVGLGTFDTGGRVNRANVVRFFSDDSRARGWGYIVVPRSTVYLAFLPPRRTNIWSYLAMLNSTQLWRVDVTENTKVLYAGTLHVTGDAGTALFGGKYLKNFNLMEVSSELSEAQILIDRFAPSLAPLKTAIMQRHDGPLIFTTPTSR